MNSWRNYLLPLALAPLGAAAAAPSSAYEPAPFAHYQPILDRMPFGVPPAVPTGPSIDLDAIKTAQEEKMEQQQLAKQLSFSALNITPKGTVAVGFTDRSSNPPQSHYLEVGGAAQGWTVVAADPDEDWAQFEKDGVTVTMHLFKGMIDGPPTGDAASATNAPADAAATVGTPATPAAAVPPPTLASGTTRPTTVPGLVRRPALASGASPVSAVGAPANAAPADAGGAPSYLERLRERKEQENAAKAAVARAEREGLQELARKIAQDEMAKRELETTAALEELRMQQELFQIRQAEEAAKAEADALAAQQQMPQEEPAPEPEQE
jgi:hypothetical protein